MKKILPWFILGLFSIALTRQAYGVTISANLPGFTAGADTTPGGYINGFYRIALFAGGILAFGAIVFGGILYTLSGANPSGKSEGKAWITSALLGLLLLACAWIVLYTINPNLVNLNLPSLSAVSSGSGQ